jgi:hypothetical protein
MTARHVRDYWGGEYEITDAEGRMLWDAHNSHGTYQPPGEELDTAKRLIAQGWLEQYGDFASLTTTGDGWWIAASWYGEVAAQATAETTSGTRTADCT